MVGAQWPHDEDLHAWWVEPDRILAGEYPVTGAGGFERLDLLLDAGIVTIVDLTAPADGLIPYRDAWERAGAARGVAVRHLPAPIPDFGVVDAATYTRIVEAIDAELAQDRPVYVHCWGGIGRTGTVVGCLLVAHGEPPETVIARLAELRAGTRKAHRVAPESSRQRAAITAWAGQRASG